MADGGARAAARSDAAIGVLMPTPETDEQGRLRVKALREALEKLGWNEGQSASIEVRWGNLDIERMRTLAKELVTLNADVLVAGEHSNTSSAAPNNFHNADCFCGCQ